MPAVVTFAHGRYGLGANPPIYHPTAYKLRIAAEQAAVRPQTWRVPRKLKVKNQEDTSACVGHSTSSLIEYARDIAGYEYVDLSRKMPWTEARNDEGTLGTDAGTYPHDALTETRRLGICQEQSFPFDHNFSNMPDNAALQEAASRTGCHFYQAQSVDDVVTAMGTQNCPAMFAIAVYESFFNTGGDGMVPPAAGKLAGYHAITAIGYDLNTRLIELQNSWSEQWGKAGCCFINMEQLQAIMTEAWVVSVDPAPQPEPQPVNPEPQPVDPNAPLNGPAAAFWQWAEDRTQWDFDHGYGDNRDNIKGWLGWFRNQGWAGA